MSARLPPRGAPLTSLPEVGEMAPGENYIASLTVPNRVESVRPAAMFLVQAARALAIPAAARPLFEVAITEAITNAVKHGHSGEPRGVIVCELEVAPRQLRMRIIDGGPGFAIPAPRLPKVAPEDLQALPESGYGLPIIQSVFPVVRAVRVAGRFGLELCLPLL
jgi:anti-sigma regulatory factor (Ser/Thr protein kinase)